MQNPENQRTPERIFRCGGFLDSASVSVSYLKWDCGMWCLLRCGGDLVAMCEVSDMILGEVAC